jgi:hypothetical protein
MILIDTFLTEKSTTAVFVKNKHYLLLKNPSRFLVTLLATVAPLHVMGLGQ